MFKKEKKDRLEQELHNQQSKYDVVTTEVPIKETSGSETSICIGLGLVAIIGFRAYSLYSRKAQSLTAKAATPDVQSIKAVRSGIINME